MFLELSVHVLEGVQHWNYGRKAVNVPDLKDKTAHCLQRNPALHNHEGSPSDGSLYTTLGTTDMCSNVHAMQNEVSWLSKQLVLGAR